MEPNIRKYTREEMPDFILEDFDTFTAEFNEIFYKMMYRLSPDMCLTLMTRVHASFCYHLVKINGMNINEVALLEVRAFINNLESLSGEELL